MRRYLQDQVKADLREKMVFVGGPRQVGKTTLAKSLLSDQTGYLSWGHTSTTENHHSF